MVPSRRTRIILRASADIISVILFVVAKVLDVVFALVAVLTEALTVVLLVFFVVVGFSLFVVVTLFVVVLLGCETFVGVDGPFTVTLIVSDPLEYCRSLPVTVMVAEPTDTPFMVSAPFV